jgi:hypothetical protein
VVSVTDPHGRIIGFLDRSLYCVLQVAPQLYSRGQVDPVPDPLLLGKFGSAGNKPGTSGSVKLIVAQLLKKYLALMEPEGSRDLQMYPQPNA